MKYRVISLLVLALLSTRARAFDLTLSPVANRLLAIAPADGLSNLKPLNLKKAQYSRYGGGGMPVHPILGMHIGYSSGTYVTSTETKTGGGLALFFQLGAMIEMPTRSDRSRALLCLSIAAQSVEVKTEKIATDFHMYSFPVSYTRMISGRNEDGLGFYWQLGGQLDYCYKVNIQDKKVTEHYNKIGIAPTASTGIHLPFSLRRRGETIGGGRALLGPFFSYTVGNMSADAGTELHTYVAGIRWVYIYM